MQSCKDPVPTVDDDSSKPSPTHKDITYDDKNYVYSLSEDPFHNWDFTGFDEENKRYCHGVVAASDIYEKGAKNNQYLMDGYYDCNESLAKGINSKDTKGFTYCWCNPNYEWSDYKEKRPKRIWGNTGLLAYQGWDKQAELGETRNCNGLVAIVDMWRNWAARQQKAIVKEVNGSYKCSYEEYELWDWETV